MPRDTNQPPSSEVAEILNQNLETAEQIKSTADELDVVHAVLSTQIPTDAMQGDLQAAVERTDQLEQKLSETADALDKSNQLLQQHISNQAKK
ncbi:MAG: hypothetical protein KKB95_12700 [Gammaproteobacteria bacterium]|jgi:hypothetical protein|nr:hypothetical protein [Gammaproteobacteria bacterium]MBU0828522.1 hypothetical protein [Gammaproteobacteria bacterium]MBU0892116.1 hypothetical protein [Gammaproteobacteria bacterium]MBU1352732.1 hypothetical protein [Gammaproteobacteria bacterium]MBU1505530.1 hypothetical protein [Gammaproteobacteria bacterium]